SAPGQGPPPAPLSQTLPPPYPEAVGDTTPRHQPDSAAPPLPAAAQPAQPPQAEQPPDDELVDLWADLSEQSARPPQPSPTPLSADPNRPPDDELVDLSSLGPDTPGQAGCTEPSDRPAPDLSGTLPGLALGRGGRGRRLVPPQPAKPTALTAQQRLLLLDTWQ